MTNAALASEFVTDTIGLVLRIERRQLSEKVKSIFDSVESGEHYRLYSSDSLC